MHARRHAAWMDAYMNVCRLHSLQQVHAQSYRGSDGLDAHSLRADSIGRFFAISYTACGSYTPSFCPGKPDKARLNRSILATRNMRTSKDP